MLRLGKGGHIPVGRGRAFGLLVDADQSSESQKDVKSVSGNGFAKEPRCAEAELLVAFLVFPGLTDLLPWRLKYHH